MQYHIKEYGSEYDILSNDLFYKKDALAPILCGANLFLSGRDALKAIALSHKHTHKRALLPALCCQSMVSPFRFNNYEIIYYKLNEDYSVSVDDIKSKLDNKSIFVYMDYFSLNSISKIDLSDIKNTFLNALIVKDITHNPLKYNLSDNIVDYYVCSARKWLSLPDGGFIMSNKALNVVKNEDTYFSALREQAMREKSEYLKNGDIKIKNIYREKFNAATAYLDKTESIFNISDTSYNILKDIDFNAMLKKRENNINYLKDKLKNNGNLKIISYKSLLYLPVLVNNQSLMQAQLAERNIYAPVIWPLPYDACNVCAVAEHTSQHMLALPCDYRYDTIDMDYMADVVNSLT